MEFSRFLRIRNCIQPPQEICCETVFIPLCDTYRVVFTPGGCDLQFLGSTCGECECFVQCNEIDLNAGIFDVTFSVSVLAEVEVCINPNDLDETTCSFVNLTCGPGPTPPVDCESCSIFYNQGEIDATLNLSTGPAIEGSANPLTIRFCAPCNNPRFNQVRVFFNPDEPTNPNDFDFNGFITAINSCSAESDDAVFEGQGTIVGGPLSGSYSFTLTIVTDNVTGNQVITFNFENLLTDDTFSLELRPSTSSPDQRVDIEDCDA